MDLIAAITAEQFQTLPEDAQGNYVERDGAYVLNIAPVSLKVGDQTRYFALEDVGGLKSSLNKRMASEKELKAKLDVYKLEDGSFLDAQEAQEAMAKLKELGDNPPEGDLKKQFEQRVEAFRAQLETKHKNELAARDQELEARGQRLQTREGQLKRLLIDNAATAAIAAAKGNVELLLPHVKDRCRCVESKDDQDYTLEILDGNGEPMYSATGGSVKKATMADLVEEFKNSNTYAVAFEGSSARGSGAGSAQPGGSHKPFTITKEQARDPHTYRRMKEQAEKAGQSLQFAE